jgi:hypothetical protein
MTFYGELISPAFLLHDMDRTENKTFRGEHTDSKVIS